MIKSFQYRETEKLFITGKSRKFPPAIIKTSIRKLDYINAVNNILDLRIPPGNKLEMLKGNLKGKYCIRINDQYRIIFRFEKSNAFDVQIIDYHK
ncbi:MAG: type II toxin-antitoxin system RelE/ParE family toxin [Ignavibacteria bacterium]|nr:MAG: type II toxin-antitoxin system RelE/ParE family toxin [Ignavibacteria bacterium]